MFSATYKALIIASMASFALSQNTAWPATPLIDQTWPDPSAVPYKVFPEDTWARGPQSGYNICNSTTENQQSLCQTFWWNSPSDWCVTVPPNDKEPLANQEGEMVAACVKKGHGTRLLLDGTVKGLEWRQTPNYIQFVGLVDQTLMNMAEDDYGGELDSGGADGLGNPKGALAYSTAFGGSVLQTQYWTCFVGGGRIACKACDPRTSKEEQHKHCEHIYDRIGIEYNMPNAVKEGEFVECQADNAEYPGIYTSDGQVMTYTQPNESLGAISTMPYTATVPPRSNCKTYASTDIFQALPTGTSSAKKTSSAAASATGKSGSSAAASGSKAASGSAAAAQSTNTGAADAVVVSVGSTLFGVIFAALFLA